MWARREQPPAQQPVPGPRVLPRGLQGLQGLLRELHQAQVFAHRR